MNLFKKTAVLKAEQKESPALIHRTVKMLEHVKPGRVLDVGCRKGWVQKFMAKESVYYGIDFCDFSKYVKNFKLVDVTSEKLPFKKSFFDTVLLGEVLEHLPKFDLLMNELNRVVKKKGAVVVTVPNIHFLPLSLLGVYKKVRLDCPVDEHVCGFGEFELINLFKMYGFKPLLIERVWRAFKSIKLPENNLFNPFAHYILGVFEKE